MILKNFVTGLAAGTVAVIACAGPLFAAPQQTAKTICCPNPAPCCPSCCPTTGSCCNTCCVNGVCCGSKSAKATCSAAAKKVAKGAKAKAAPAPARAKTGKA